MLAVEGLLEEQKDMAEVEGTQRNFMPKKSIEAAPSICGSNCGHPDSLKGIKKKVGKKWGY